MDKQEISRNELYNLVWNETLTSVADKFGIQYYQLRDLCKKMNIPMPKAGYWTRIRHGQDITPPQLPENKTVNEIITVSLSKKNPELTPLQKLIAEIESTPDLPLNVPEKLTRPHILIESLRKSISNKSECHERNGLISPYWQKDEIDILVSPGNVNRALRTMNAIINLLKTRKHNVILKDRTTYAVVFDEKIQIRIAEKLNRTLATKKFESATYSPSGFLKFMIGYGYDSKEVMDGNKPLEDQLSRILALLEIEARHRIDYRLECEKHRKKEEEERRKAQIIRERKIKEFKKFQNLISLAEKWNQAKFIREFIKDREIKAAENNNLTEDLESWIIWARNKADWYDPLINKKDEVLDDYETENKNLNNTYYY